MVDKSGLNHAELVAVNRVGLPLDCVEYIRFDDVFIASNSATDVMSVVFSEETHLVYSFKAVNGLVDIVNTDLGDVLPFTYRTFDSDHASWQMKKIGKRRKSDVNKMFLFPTGIENEVEVYYNISNGEVFMYAFNMKTRDVKIHKLRKYTTFEVPNRL